jgi:hypothetical protein
MFSYPGNANIQARPTPEMWQGISMPKIVVAENAETFSISLASANLFAPLLPISLTDNTETQAIALSAVVRAAPPVQFLSLSDNTETQGIALASATLIPAATASLSDNTETQAIALSSATNFLALVNLGSLTDNTETQSIALASATYAP